MFDKILSNIVRHLSLLDLIKSQSKKIFYYALEENDDRVENFLANRERMIAQAQKLKSDTELELKKIPSNISLKDKNQMNEIISTWCLDINKWIETLRRIDSEISEVLEIRRELTKLNIQKISSSRRKVSGYNLNTVR